jgi:hypothetical protein
VIRRLAEQVRSSQPLWLVPSHAIGMDAVYVGSLPGGY